VVYACRMAKRTTTKKMVSITLPLRDLVDLKAAVNAGIDDAHDRAETGPEDDIEKALAEQDRWFELVGKLEAAVKAARGKR